MLRTKEANACNLFAALVDKPIMVVVTAVSVSVSHLVHTCPERKTAFVCVLHTRKGFCMTQITSPRQKATREDSYL